MKPALILLATALLPSALFAEPRTWHSSDGSRTFTGEYLSHDARSVTIRRADGRTFTLDILKLNAQDQAWLKQHDSPGPVDNFDLASVEGAVFDTLKFGDTHAEVMANLRGSKAVEFTVPEMHLARMGLDGSFRTRQQIGGLHFLLYFDWDDSSRLTELTLQTEPQKETAYAKELKAIWTELATLMSARHGPPANASTYPAAEQLTQDRMALGSHLWKTDAGHSILLGTAREGDRYSVILRFNSSASPPAAPRR